ncbi:hypothetical protein FN846DRAFT_954588, partial [Sphaerosporella brunnea]
FFFFFFFLCGDIAFTYFQHPTAYASARSSSEACSQQQQQQQQQQCRQKEGRNRASAYVQKYGFGSHPPWRCDRQTHAQ